MSAPTGLAETPKVTRQAAGLLQAFSPNKILSRTAMNIIIAVQVAIFLLLWTFSAFAVLPKPLEVLNSIRELWFKQGLGQELITSVTLNLEAVAISSVISIGLAYLTVMPFFRPIVNALGKGRFLSMAGFTLVFTLIVGGGHPLKLSLLVFAMTVFFVTSMAAVVSEIPKADFDYARTLRMSEWRVVWEVVVLGTADKAFEVLRQNAAIGWMMLTLVEGIYRGEGGIGALLLNQQKFFKMSEVFGIQIIILIVGLFQDVIIGFVRRAVCPYAVLTLERK
ncbi:TauC ABC-type nitrate/sulfonate/bicarbonate transport system, permease component [Fimbriimonadaceae bacterium]